MGGMALATSVFDPPPYVANGGEISTSLRTMPELFPMGDHNPLCCTRHKVVFSIAERRKPGLFPTGGQSPVV